MGKRALQEYRERKAAGVIMPARPRRQRSVRAWPPPEPSGRDHAAEVLSAISAHQDLYNLAVDGLRKQKSFKVKARIYGLSIHQIQEMEHRQGGLCYICRETPSSRGLNVDHCHSTGRVRKLLCSRCNTALGVIENLSLHEKLVAYITEHQ